MARPRNTLITTRNESRAPSTRSLNSASVSNSSCGNMVANGSKAAFAAARSTPGANFAEITASLSSLKLASHPDRSMM